MKCKLVFTDIDGVWTDGGMYYSANGEELKKFNTIDSGGVLLLKALRIPLVVISGETSPSAEMRMQKLKIDNYFPGIKNKLEFAVSYCKNANIALSDVAYIGDDLNDIHLLQKAGISAVPASARDYVKKEAHWVLNRKGGEGVFREFVEKLLEEENRLDEALRIVMESM